jgi:hypothetical protein
LLWVGHLTDPPGITKAEATKIVHTIHPPKKKKASTAAIAAVDTQSSLDIAHDVYMELKPKAFITEIINLIFYTDYHPLACLPVQRRQRIAAL